MHITFARLFTPPTVALGAGLTIQWMRQLPWDVLLRMIAFAALALWLAAVAVTVWCVCVRSGKGTRVSTAGRPSPPLRPDEASVLGSTR